MKTTRLIVTGTLLFILLLLCTLLLGCSSRRESASNTADAPGEYNVHSPAQPQAANQTSIERLEALGISVAHPSTPGMTMH